jgi:hypothetical protein
VFGLAVAQIRVVLKSKESSLHEAIQARVRAEGGALVGWLAGAAVARRVLGSITQELEKIEPDDSELRAAFETWLLAEIDKLENDPGRAEVIGRAMRDAMAHPTVNAWLMDVWDRLKTALAADAGRSDGRSVALVSGLLGNLGALLGQDEAARARVNGMVERMARALSRRWWATGTPRRWSTRSSCGWGVTCNSCGSTAPSWAFWPAARFTRCCTRCSGGWRSSPSFSAAGRFPLDRRRGHAMRATCFVWSRCRPFSRIRSNRISACS